MRVIAEQVTPFDDVVKTMSFAAPCFSKRESDQARQTFPAPSTSAVGSDPLRTLPASGWWRTGAMVTTVPQLPPPVGDVKAPTAVSNALYNGTTTVTSGRPPGV